LVENEFFGTRQESNILSGRIDKSWVVLKSFEDKSRCYCVDVFTRPDGCFGFEEFRRDPEDQGKWSGVKYYSGTEYQSEEQALQSATQKIT